MASSPSAAKWNILGTNDASFNDGTGIGAGAIATNSIANAAVTSPKLAPSMATNYNVTYPSFTNSSYQDISGSSFNITVAANATKYYIYSIVVARWSGTPSVEVKANLVLDGTQITESRMDPSVNGDCLTFVLTITGTKAAGTYALKNQAKAATGSLQIFDNRTTVMFFNS